jgi:putative DNA primase/helicase
MLRYPAWGVEGCLKWQQERLGLSKAVEVANQEYRSEMDILAPFIEGCCELGTEYEVKSKALYEAYKKWCEANGEKDLPQKKLTSRLLERGDITKRRFGHQGTKGLKGIGLINELLSKAAAR